MSGHIHVCARTCLVTHVLVPGRSLSAQVSRALCAPFLEARTSFLASSLMSGDDRAAASAAHTTSPPSSPTVGPTSRRPVPPRSRSPGPGVSLPTQRTPLQVNRRVVHVTIPPTRRRDAGVDAPLPTTGPVSEERPGITAGPAASAAGPAVPHVGPIRPLPKRRLHGPPLMDPATVRHQVYHAAPLTGPVHEDAVPAVIRDDSPLPILNYLSRADVTWPWQPERLYWSSTNPLADVSPQDIAAALWHARRSPRGPQWWHATLKSYVHFYPENFHVPLHPSHANWRRTDVGLFVETRQWGSLVQCGTPEAPLMVYSLHHPRMQVLQSLASPSSLPAVEEEEGLLVCLISFLGADPQRGGAYKGVMHTCTHVSH
eukprot:360716-Amphidinium_carterae.1